MKFKHTSHWLHFFLTLFTGFWAVFWIVVALSNSCYNRRLEISLMKQQIELLERLVDRT